MHLQRSVRALVRSSICGSPRRLAVAAVLSVWSVSLASQATSAQSQSTPLDLAPASYTIPLEMCGTEIVYLQSLGLVTPLEIADGQALMFDQTPAIIRPDLTGSFSITVQLVGDLPTMRFLRWDPDATEDNIETWARTSTRTVAGRLVSIFAKSYADTELARILRRQRWGFDDGGLFWGQVLLDDTDETAAPVLLPSAETKPGLSLRIGSTNLPAAAPLVQLSPDVQYAGSVVNIRIPEFGDSRVADGDHGFDLVAAANMFYEFFPDAYDMIAFIP